MKNYLIWLLNDEVQPFVAGVATSMARAVMMQNELEETFGDSYEIEIVEVELDTLTINDEIIHFPKQNR